jgi:hypothetical protein
MASAGAVGIALGGKAQVYCVHNQPKRETTELAFDPALTSIHLCSCCENVFLERSDVPMFCSECRGETFFTPAGPLPNPLGRL